MTILARLQLRALVCEERHIYHQIAGLDILKKEGLFGEAEVLQYELLCQRIDSVETQKEFWYKLAYRRTV